MGLLKADDPFLDVMAGMMVAHQRIIIEVAHTMLNARNKYMEHEIRQEYIRARQQAQCDMHIDIHKMLKDG